MNKKQNASRPKEFLILLLLIAALTANVLYWGGKKEGYHTDEMFSYAQIGDTEYWRIWFDRPGEPYLNYWHDPSYYETFLTVSADEAFDLAGAWNTACDNDAHPPLYFVMLDLVTSLFFQDDYTKWSGLVTNLPFYVLSLLLVYLSGKKLFGGRFLPSAVGMLFFGGCVGVVSIAIYIRMYMMAVFFSALLFYVHCLLYEKVFLTHSGTKKCIPLCVFLFLTIFAGVLTHYYFLVPAFFTCLFFCLCLLLRKRWSLFALYSGCALGSVLAAAAVCPDFLDDLLHSQRGTEAISNVSSGDCWMDKIFSFSHEISDNFFASFGRLLLLLFLLLFVLFCISTFLVRLSRDAEGDLIVSVRRKRSDPQTQDPQGLRIPFGFYTVFILIFVLAVICSILLIARIAPDTQLHYISNVFPEICLISCYIAYHAVGWFTSSRSCRAAALCILVLLGGLGYLQTGVSYLYLGCSEQLSLLQHFPDHRAIVVTDVDSDCANLAPYLLESSAVYQSHVENISALYPGFHAAPSEIVILYINYQNPDLTIGQIASNVKDGLRAKNILNLFHTVGTQTCEVYALSFD